MDATMIAEFPTGGKDTKTVLTAKGRQFTYREVSTDYDMSYYDPFDAEHISKELFMLLYNMLCVKYPMFTANYVEE